MSRSVAIITVGAISGGILGLVIGLLAGAGNPFSYAAIGIGIGAAISIPFFVRGG